MSRNIGLAFLPLLLGSASAIAQEPARGAAGAVTGDQPAAPTAQPPAKPQVQLRFDLRDDHDSWQTGFADYPVGAERTYQLRAGPADRPRGVGPGKAIILSGFNHSDDLFMFAARKLEGLEPNTRYQVRIQVAFASDAEGGGMGVGGSPAEAVVVKGGVMAREPAPVRVKMEGSNQDYWRMNVDKGNQSTSGKDAVALGHIAKPGERAGWEVVRRGTDVHPPTFTTGPDGAAWLLLGTDSGFEGKSTIYLLDVQVELRKLPARPKR